MQFYRGFRRSNRWCATVISSPNMMLPVVKLGTLALRTVSRPIATRLKKEAGLHPKFRRFIINIAQTNHRLQTNMQRSIYGYSTNVEIRPLNEEKAIQAAADLLGELFVFTVGGAAIIFEVYRSSKSEARKEELRKQELQSLKLRDEDLAREVELLKHKLQELEQLARGQGLSGLSKFLPALAHATKGWKNTTHQYQEVKFNMK